jgi:hypothetical protein
MAAAVLFRPSAKTWVRGPARLDGEMIAIEMREAYDPSTAPRLAVGLLAVRTPEDAVAFASRYGLLKLRGDEPLLGPQGLEWTRVTTDQEAMQFDKRWRVTQRRSPPELREPYATFEAAAKEMRSIVRFVLKARKAATGDQTARAWLEAKLNQLEPAVTAASEQLSGPEEKLFKQVERYHRRSVEAYATFLGSILLDSVLEREDARVRVGYTEPGQLRFLIVPETLLGFCYIDLAKSLGERDALEICPQCGRVFPVDDPRQKFCEPACAARSRFQRFEEKHRAKRRKKENSHGKKTRTR